MFLVLEKFWGEIDASTDPQSYFKSQNIVHPANLFLQLLQLEACVESSRARRSDYCSMLDRSVCKAASDTLQSSIHKPFAVF